MIFKKIFKLQVINPETGLELSAAEIYLNLRGLVESNQETGVGLGVMTAESRDVWYEVYSKLSQSKL